MPMTIKPVRFENDALDRLKTLAAIEGRDVSYLVRSAVDDLLNAHEWQIQQSIKVAAMVKSGEMPVVDHDAVREKFQKSDKSQ